jgi:hypothetical protein
VPAVWSAALKLVCCTKGFVLIFEEGRYSTERTWLDVLFKEKQKPVHRWFLHKGLILF